jgi:hypothetical protein
MVLSRPAEREIFGCQCNCFLAKEMSGFLREMSPTPMG